MEDSKKNSKFLVSGIDILPYLVDLARYMNSTGVDLAPYPKVRISTDTSYQNDPFGRTAYYDPENKSITLFVAGRHIKDVLRSFSHELIHHNQNLTGAFDKSHLKSLENPKYAEEDQHLRKMEEDAYLRGNMIFRAWEDSHKYSGTTNK